MLIVYEPQLPAEFVSLQQSRSGIKARHLFDLATNTGVGLLVHHLVALGRVAISGQQIRIVCFTVDKDSPKAGVDLCCPNDSLQIAVKEELAFQMAFRPPP